MTDAYPFVQAFLDGRAFLLPLHTVVAVVPRDAVGVVPAPPAGVCGLVPCSEGVCAVVDAWGVRHEPSTLQIVCCPEAKPSTETAPSDEADAAVSHLIAFTADAVGETCMLSCQ